MSAAETNVPGQDNRIQKQCQQYFDLVEGGICLVLADGTERVVFANDKVASLYECEDVGDLLLLCSHSYRNLMEEEDYRPLSEVAGEHPGHSPSRSITGYRGGTSGRRRGWAR